MELLESILWPASSERADIVVVENNTHTLAAN